MAVIDVDWTLLVATSAESLLLNFLREKKLLNWRQVLRSLDYSARSFPHGLIESFLKNKYYLSGLNVDMLTGRMDQFYEQWVKPKIAVSMLETIHRLKSEHYHIILLSGTLDFLTKVLCDKLELHAGIGSALEIRNQKFTGRMTGIYPIHNGKVHLLHRYLKGQPVDWQASCAFGDSYWDIPLLNLVGHPVAVHPDVALRKEAKRRGWSVESRQVEIRNPLQRVWIESVYRRSM